MHLVPAATLPHPLPDTGLLSARVEPVSAKKARGHMVTLRMSDKEFRALRKLAKANEVSRSAVIRSRLLPPTRSVWVALYGPGEELIDVAESPEACVARMYEWAITNGFTLTRSNSCWYEVAEGHAVNIVEREVLPP